MKKTKKLVIFGTDLLAKMAYVHFHEDSMYEVVGFTVNREYLKTEKFLGLPVFDYEESRRIFPADEYSMFVAIGSSRLNDLREKVYQVCKNSGYNLATYIHSSVKILGEKNIGDNCFILGTNNIDPFVTIGNNVFMWAHNHIGHETIISDNVFISSGVIISGSCLIGRNCFLGVNSAVADNVSIGSHSFIGMGVNVTQDVPEGSILKPEVILPRDYNTDRMRGLVK